MFLVIAEIRCRKGQLGNAAVIQGRRKMAKSKKREVLMLMKGRTEESSRRNPQNSVANWNMGIKGEDIE